MAGNLENGDGAVETGPAAPPPHEETNGRAGLTNNNADDHQSDLEAIRAREVSLSLQNYRLKEQLSRHGLSPLTSPSAVGLSPQGSGDLSSSALAEARPKAATDARRLSLVESWPLDFDVAIIPEEDRTKRIQGKLIFAVQCITIVPLEVSFSLAEYVGYRKLEPSQAERSSPQKEQRSPVMKTIGRYLAKMDFAQVFHTPGIRSAATGGGSGAVTWELMWKQGVGYGLLHQLRLQTSVRIFEEFESLIQEWGQSVESQAGLSPNHSSNQPPAGEADAERPAALAAAPSLQGIAVSTPTAVPLPSDLGEPSDASAEVGREADTSTVRPKEISKPSPQTLRLSFAAETSSMFSVQHLEALREELPASYRQSKWRLAYASLKDGISLQTLYRRAAHVSPTVLLVQDYRQHIFGVFAPDPWKVHPMFYGTGETFVFKLQPEIKIYHWDQDGHSPSCRNNFFMFGANDCLAVGGGGHFALWLDEDLLFGNSSPCRTFGNESLAGSENFEVLSVELWHLSP